MSPERTGTGLPCPSPLTFGEHQAARIFELERALQNTRREVLRLRRSRDMWRLRYQWAAAAARRVQRADNRLRAACVKAAA